jgi:hypothetical protein
MPTLRTVTTMLALGGACAAASCAGDRAPSSHDVRAATAGRVAALRERFRLAGPLLSPATAPRGLRTATVDLPQRASAPVRIVDDVSQVTVRFALVGAAGVPLATEEGIALYAGALGGADLLHRTSAEGTEDFVVLEAPREREELAYDVDVSGAAGLRLVSNTLEFLDAGGTPRLRMAPPHVVDEEGACQEATTSIEGCAYDTSPAAPWGRTPTRAGAPQCLVRVRWSGARYPLLVDPSWVATGSMTTGRNSHTATLLSSGAVLLAGGNTSAGSYSSSAELFDGVSAFAATGSMTAGRANHTATLLPSGQVLVAGGSRGSGSSTTMAELFDGAGTFTATGSMTMPREYHTATLLSSGRVLVAGGFDPPFTLSSAELFDGTATFTATGPMSVSRQNHTATLLPSGKVLVAGGVDAAALSSAELFDGTSTFTATGSLTSPRYDHAASVLSSGKVLVASGYATTTGGAALTTAELFDGVSAFTLTTGVMSNPRDSATLLGSGEVLLTGGAAQTTELFDGVSAFRASGNMTTLRTFPTVTLLQSGKVLAAGGGGAVGFLSTAELFAFVTAGGSCAIGGECQSRVCDEGICCAAACPNNNVCQACAAGTGACSTITNGDDPDHCPAVTSTCDASGLCKLKNGQPQTDPTQCASGYSSDGVCCNTACAGACDVCTTTLGATADGQCTPAPLGYAGNPPCTNGGQCDGTAASCPSPCASDADCVAGDYCASNGACAASKGNGQSCNIGAGGDCRSAPCRECTSGHCASGTCVACAADGDCTTGHCVDRVCCNTACTEQCAACDGAGTVGLCAAVVGAPHGTRPACPSGGAACATAQCNGVDVSSCRALAGQSTLCAPAACNANRATPAAFCDGDGGCGPPAAAIDCGVFTCDPSTGQCRSSCVADTDCANGARCAGGKCLAGPQCTDDHTSRSSTGVVEDCTPYRCDTTGACKTSCLSLGDCASPNVCDSSGHCGAAPLSNGGSGGCDAGASQRPFEVAPLALLGLALAAARRRRHCGL